MQEKALNWPDAGTRMVLVVDPQQRTATVYRSRNDVTLLGGDGVIDGGDVVPGWRVRVAELFV